MAQSNTLSLDESSFQRLVLESDQPVLVDFSASWCGPCRTIAPIVDAIADELVGQSRVGKVDIDQSPRLAERYRVRSIPTLLLFQRGQVVDQLIGAASREQILALIARRAAASKP